MHIEIESNVVHEGQTNAGKPKREQKALLWKDGEKHPDKIVLRLHNNAPGYPEGEYDIHQDSFGVNQYGGLELSFFDFRLQPRASKK